jgi:hypothetical protein
MLEAPPQPELMLSLRRLVRGLTALFWGLPFTLLVSAQSAVAEWLRPLGGLPPIIGTATLCFAVWEIGHFQKEERDWQQTLDRAKLLGLINVGLSPFIFFWNKLPAVAYYWNAVGLLALTGILFLFSLNQVLQRLAAMLPDETLRADTQVFTSLNLGLMLGMLVLVAVFVTIGQLETLPPIVNNLLNLFYKTRHTLAVFLILLPVAMTMSLIWKIRDVVLASVFNRA